MRTDSLMFRIGLVLVLCALCIGARLLFFPGIHLVADDTRYSRAGYEIARGEIDLPTNHHNARLANTFSIALFYRLFGVGEYSAIGASLVYSLSNMLLIFLFAYELFRKRAAFWIGAVAALCYAFVPISMQLGASLLPLQGQSFFMFLAMYLLLKGAKRKNNRYFVFGGVSIGIAYLFHETAVFIFLAVLAYGLYVRKPVRIVGLTIAGFLLIVCCETSIYYFKTGKLLYRPTLTQNTRFDTTHTDTTINASTVKRFKTIDNPFSGTFLGDSWLLEPFRQLALNPAHSIIYPLFFLFSLLLFWERDRHIAYLSLLFWPLFLYYSYGTPTPLTYMPLRRLPRYILPCLIPVCLTVGYGVHVFLERRLRLKFALLGAFIGISLLSMSVKGGEIGQLFHQSKFFYAFMQARPDAEFVTDSKTLLGLEFLSVYQDLPQVKSVAYRDLIPATQTGDFLEEYQGAYLFVTIPELYGEQAITLDDLQYRLLDEHQRRPRRICQIPGMAALLPGSVCDLSHGGKIYRVR